MKRVFLTFIMGFLLSGSAYAHGGISDLPDSVQIMQYKMKLYVNQDDAETIINLAMAYYRTDVLPKAAKLLQAVIKKDSNNFDALNGMGLVLLRDGKSSEALDYLKRAVAVNAKDVMVHVHLAVVHEQLKQLDLAGKELDEAHRLAADTEELRQVEAEKKRISTAL